MLRLFRRNAGALAKLLCMTIKLKENNLMKKKISLFSLPVLVLVFLSFSGKPKFNMTGKWKVTSYAYNQNGRFDFYFVSGNSYEFNADSTGRIITLTDTTNFKWYVNKYWLSLIKNNETKYFKIDPGQTNSTVMLLDPYAGKDENRSYNAMEKGMILEKQ